MGWLQWLMVTIASSATVGLLVRHLTKTAITHAFKVNLENVKFEHSQELQRMKAEMDAHSKREIEYIKAEIALFANNATNDADREKALYMTVANARATSYPKLVSVLRRMKRQFEGLAYATKSSGGGPVNLGGQTKRAELVRKAISELQQLEKEFDDELSAVRLFTKRSDYYLQQRVRQFCNQWHSLEGRFEVSEEFLRSVVADYNDDISFLSDEFYRPEIAIPQSGERLALLTVLVPTAGDYEAAATSLDAQVANQEAREPSFEDWLASRKPGSKKPAGRNSP